MHRHCPDHQPSEMLYLSRVFIPWEAAAHHALAVASPCYSLASFCPYAENAPHSKKKFYRAMLRLDLNFTRLPQHDIFPSLGDIHIKASIRWRPGRACPYVCGSRHGLSGCSCAVTHMGLHQFYTGAFRQSGDTSHSTQEICPSVGLYASAVGGLSRD